MDRAVRLPSGTSPTRAYSAPCSASTSGSLCAMATSSGESWTPSPPPYYEPNAPPALSAPPCSTIAGASARPSHPTSFSTPAHAYSS